MKKKISFTESSGNVFADLKMENPEENLAKAEMVRQISKIMKKRKLSQKQTAEILGIDQPKVSALIHGKLRSFSLERLIRFLNDLGQDVSIVVSPVQPNLERGHTWVGESTNVLLTSLGHEHLLYYSQKISHHHRRIS